MRRLPPVGEDGAVTQMSCQPDACFHVSAREETVLGKPRPPRPPAPPSVIAPITFP